MDGTYGDQESKMGRRLDLDLIGFQKGTISTSSTGHWSGKHKASGCGGGAVDYISGCCCPEQLAIAGILLSLAKSLQYPLSFKLWLVAKFDLVAQSELRAQNVISHTCECTQTLQTHKYSSEARKSGTYHVIHLRYLITSDLQGFPIGLAVGLAVGAWPWIT